jgi:hypothetical protein
MMMLIVIDKSKIQTKKIVKKRIEEEEIGLQNVGADAGNWVTRSEAVAPHLARI